MTDAAAATTAATATATTAATTTAAPTDWRAGLTGDYAPLAAEKSLADVKGKDWAEAGPVLAKRFVDTHKMVGAKTEGMVRVPGTDAKPEDVAAFRKALGVPDDPAGYQVTRPEVAAGQGPGGALWSDEIQAGFVKAMHETGATSAQVQAAINFYGGMIAADMAAGQREAQAVEADLRTKWGPNYDANVGRANRAITEFGGDPLIQLFTANGMGRHPLVVAAFAKIGNALVEHGAMAPEGLGARMSPTEARTKLAEMRRDRKHPLNNQSDPGFNDALQEVVALQRIADRKE